jgi:hypothetical protein
MGEITQNMYLTFKQTAHEVVNWIQRAQGSVQRVELADNLQNPNVPLKVGKSGRLRSVELILIMCSFAPYLFDRV